MSGWNGAGVFNRIYSWVNDAANGIDIIASRMDADTNNITLNGFGNCLTRDGQGSATAALPMNGFTHTGVGNATQVANYAAAGQIQLQSLTYAIGAGTGNAVTVTITPAIAALTDGLRVQVKAPAGNTITNPTFSPNGQTATVIKKLGGVALSSGEYAAGQILDLQYVASGPYWSLLNTSEQAPFKNSVRSSWFATLVLAVAACPANGFVWIDSDYTLGADLDFTSNGIRGIGAGGIITLGTYTLTGDFWTLPNIQMFNINSSGLVNGVYAGGEVWCEWFGAASSAESATAINAAIHYANAAASPGAYGNRRVKIGSGYFLISAQLVLPDGVSLDGQGTIATTLALSNTFSQLSTSGLIRVGDGTTESYGTLLSNVKIEMGGNTGIACFSSDAQDGSGFQHIIINSCSGKGVVMVGGDSVGHVNNFILDDIAIFKYTGGITGTAVEIGNGSNASGIRNITVAVRNTAQIFSYGFKVYNISLQASALSIDADSAAIGLDIGNPSNVISIDTLTILGGNATGVNIAGTGAAIKIAPLLYNGGGNAVIDAGGGGASPITIAGNIGLTEYVRGTSYTNGTINFVTLPSSDPGVSGQLWTNSHIVTRSP